mmetsp:Transcript_23233/g.59311  ORF Transcript_23233/g.59311 Transcript_23233/m.59311 type:complete len:206 (+) Transcript_23233:606-1223(+)
MPARRPGAQDSPEVPHSVDVVPHAVGDPRPSSRRQAVQREPHPAIQERSARAPHGNATVCRGVGPAPRQGPRPALHPLPPRPRSSCGDRRRAGTARSVLGLPCDLRHPCPGPCPLSTPQPVFAAACSFVGSDFCSRAWTTHAALFRRALFRHALCASPSFRRLRLGQPPAAHPVRRGAAGPHPWHPAAGQTPLQRAFPAACTANP